MGYGSKELQEEDKERVERESSGDYSGGWGSAYSKINEINRRNREESEEYKLKEEITQLTLKNNQLSIDNNNLYCENGRLKRTIIKMELNK